MLAVRFRDPCKEELREIVFVWPSEEADEWLCLPCVLGQWILRAFLKQGCRLGSNQTARRDGSVGSDGRDLGRVERWSVWCLFVMLFP